MIFWPEEVLPIAESAGFRAEMIEKVLHLLNLLDKLNRCRIRRAACKGMPSKAESGSAL